VSRSNPIDGFEIDPASLSFIGEGLQRPECILAEPDGSLWTADPGFAAASSDAERFTGGTLPNGLAFDADGSFLVANFGTDRLVA
jgi:sugar lactone lactonase YvrE